MNDKIDVAIIGATSPIGEAVLEQMAIRKFPVENLIPLAFDNDDETDTTIQFAGKNIHIQNIAKFNFANVPLIFLCGVNESYQAIVDRILDANCKLVEVGSNLQNAPAVIAGINTDESFFNDSQHIRSASGLAVVLTQLLKPIQDSNKIKALNFTALHSVSDKGKAGIDELAMQTTSLLNTRPIKPHVFKKQISFNVMTDDGEMNATGFTANELNVTHELKDLLFKNGTGIESIMPSFIHIPVFYGVSIDVHIELTDDIDLNTIETTFSSIDNVELQSIDDIITPVSHAAEMDKIFVNRLRQDTQISQRVNFWCVTDTIKSGSAINGVQIGEILVKHHL